MRFLKQALNIDFMARRKLAMGLSVVLILMSLISFGVRGLSLGIDFTGGHLVEVGYPSAVELGGIREALGQAGFDEAIVQHFGTARDVLVRLAPHEGATSSDLSDRVLQALQATGEVQMRRIEFVGPQVGEELREKGGLAMLAALAGILLYVMVRFEMRLAVGAVVALAHDVIITLGIFSLFQLEFDLSILAAILAVIGYSLNDTIVVFDRIRENFRKIRKGSPIEVLNFSINQTLSRTVMTSFTTLLVLAALFFFGGEVIQGFAFALIVGVIVGTYSSIYVGSTMALVLGVSKTDLMPVKKEGETQDDRP